MSRRNVIEYTIRKAELFIELIFFLEFIMHSSMDFIRLECLSNICADTEAGLREEFMDPPPPIGQQQEHPPQRLRLR